MKNFFNKYLFPTLTVFNTYSAVMAIISLAGPTATPFTAFIATMQTIIVIGSWSVIFYERSMKKFINDNSKNTEDKLKSLIRISNET